MPVRCRAVAARAGHRRAPDGPCRAGRLDRLVAGCLVAGRRPGRRAHPGRQPGHRCPRRGDHLRAAGGAAVAAGPGQPPGPVRGRPGRRRTGGAGPLAAAVGQHGLSRGPARQPRPAGHGRHDLRDDRRGAGLASAIGSTARPGSWPGRGCSRRRCWPPRWPWSPSACTCHGPRPAAPCCWRSCWPWRPGWPGRRSAAS